MSFKISNILKANSRIEELESQLAAKDLEIANLSSNPAQIEAAYQAQLAELTQLRADHATAKQTIGTLETAAKHHTAQAADLTARLAETQQKLAAHLANVPAHIETAAAAKSVQIAASQGIPPLPIKVAANPLDPKSSKLTATERCLAANAAKKAA